MNREDLFYLVISKLRFPIILLITVYSISILGLVLIPGIDNLGNSFNMGFFDAFFIVIYTSTTVGFGETPFSWTEMQRFWMTFVTLFSVTSWLISIGQIILILQDEHIKNQASFYFFKRKISKISEPFYIIAGYGRTGQHLVEAMSNHGFTTIVIDIDKNKFSKLENSKINSNIYFINGDISDLDYLKLVKIQSNLCKGLILTTNEDSINTKSSLSAKILNPKIQIIARSNSTECSRNLKSFNTEYILSPYILLSQSIINLMYKHDYHCIERILTNEDFQFKDKIIPTGDWVIVGYKKHGKILHKQLKQHNVKCTIISNDIDKEIYTSDNFIKGEGVDEIDLRDAGIKNAKVIIATSEDDFSNLSSIITAKKMTPNIYIICIINSNKNLELFNQVGIDLCIQPFELIVRKTFSIVTEPLIGMFLKLVKNNKELELRVIKLIKSMNNSEHSVWSLNINEAKAPSLYESIQSNQKISLSDIVLNEKCNTFNIIPLLILRNKEIILLPNIKEQLYTNDTILIISNNIIKENLEWVINNYELLKKQLRKFKKGK